MSKDKNTPYPDFREMKMKCQDFLMNFIENGKFKYTEQLQEIANQSRNILEIFLDDVKLHKNDESFSENITNNAFRYFRVFEEVADDIMPTSTGFEGTSAVRGLGNNNNIFRGLNQSNVSSNGLSADLNGIADAPKVLSRRFNVAFIPLDSSYPQPLRDIKADGIGRLTITRGMVSRISDVKPHVAVCTYTCDACGFETYQEVTGHQFMPLERCTSPACKESKSTGRLQLQVRGSKFSKYQEIKIQELPDQVPIGSIPRSITIHCSDSETRKCSPGDIITVSGILMIQRRTGYRAMVSGLQADCYLKASSISKEKKNYSDLNTGSIDIQTAIRELASSDDPYDLLAKSLAPEIYGHEDIKKALLLQLVGGVSRSLSDGVKIRGDINICLMGDPGLAKSQLLKYVASVAPRGVYTTGKGSSGVGLTAAITRDNLTGEMALEGGALVLADMGICCIDEFDKMNESDRTAIHEVMEQQTVSIAKAGINTTLNARASVLAAANPSFGRYNFRKSISENVNLPNSLLSRFDLLFIIIDKTDASIDIALSKHVLFVHRYLRNPASVNQLVEPHIIKSYISEARKLIPSIPKELSSYIVEAYISMRSQQHMANQSLKADDQTALTPRQLLSILRLSQSLARLRLSSSARHADVDEALRLMQSSKASLVSDRASRSNEDYSSTIFSIIRDSVSSGDNRSVDYNIVESMIIKRGFTTDQFQKSLSEYEGLGIIMVDRERTRITMAS